MFKVRAHDYVHCRIMLSVTVIAVRTPSARAGKFQGYAKSSSVDSYQ